ncbi:MAG: TIGR02757 family protein [Marinilabiliaceae bacterium]|nr:TIGR02757 family protein [Marinilabiliaceae bacterium]
MKIEEIKIFLDEKVVLYNQPEFIVNDPISIPHLFSNKQDIEIAGFLTATIAWGRRDSILKSARKLMELLEETPSDFILHASEDEWERFNDFYYRTFSSVDCLYFLMALKRIYMDHGGLEELFVEGYRRGGVKNALSHFRDVFLSFDAPQRSAKHVANINKGASAKRLNMFLRWMVRSDGRGVDFGIWDRILPEDLFLPLDVHSGNIARRLNLLKRKQNDFKAVEEITSVLRHFDPKDPVKYDFALFGLGVNEAF